MSPLGPYLNRYRIFWLATIAAFAVLIYWLLFIKPAGPEFTQVNPEEVRNTAISDMPEKEPTIGERVDPLQLNAEGAELTISSSDGSLIMRLWAKSAVKEKQVFTMDEGALQFVMSSGTTLLVHVGSCEFRRKEDLITVRGDITGSISGTGQYFSGKRLSWDRNENIVSADEVTFVGQNIEVHGQKMHINMETGEVTFEGPVEAGV